MAITDPGQVTDVIHRVSQAIILPRFRALAEHEIKEKHPGDLVTIADIEAEAALSDALTALLPGSAVVGEEGVAADATRLDRLQQSAPVWVIDPIDGTGNFVRGNPRFGVIVALVHHQITLQGWIHEPLTGRTSYAVKGGGSWQGSDRIRLPETPRRALIGATAWRDRIKLERAGMTLRLFGSAAQEYLALLDGRLDFLCYRRLHPWDHAAGVLLHAEAGGHGALLDGEAYRPLPLDGTLLAAPDPIHWRALQEIFQD